MNGAARPEDAGRRADTVLSDLLEGQTRSGVQKLLAAGAVTRAGRPVSKNDRVSAGDVFSVEIPEPESDRAVAQDIPLEIVFEDADLIVVNKPQGMVVHPAAGHADGTLVNALLHHCGESLSGIGGVLRPGIVHRIDRDTSGLLVAAKNDAAHQGLAAQLADHTMYRVYHAVLVGTPAPAEGTIRATIGRDPHEQKTHGRHGARQARRNALPGIGIVYGLLPRRVPSGDRPYASDPRTHGVDRAPCRRGYGLRRAGATPSACMGNASTRVS